MAKSKDSRRKLRKRKKIKRTSNTANNTTSNNAVDAQVLETHDFGLNPRQMRFADEYLIDFNAYRAYCVAGYKGRGNSGYATSSQLLRHPKVREYIEHKKGLIAQQVKVTQEDVIKELKLIAFSNIGDYVEFGGKRVRLKASHELTREQLSVIEQVVEQTNTAGLKSIKLKLHPKLTALGILAKHTDVDAGDDNGKLSAEQLAQSLKDVADAMNGTLPTKENATLDDDDLPSKSKRSRKKKKKDKDSGYFCPMCEEPISECDCD